MSDALQLTQEEMKWRDELEDRVSRFPQRADYDIRRRELTELRDLALKVHDSLKTRGFEPRHHGYMIENRGCGPDDPEFYLHIHPIQDLIKFTRDPCANDDPEDTTIGDEFELRVFTRRWGHVDTYLLKRTATGWLLLGDLAEGPCDKGGQPHVLETLRHDSVRYPRDVGDLFEWIWDQAKNKGLAHDAVQNALNDVADWIKQTEKSVPRGQFWEGLL